MSGWELGSKGPSSAFWISPTPFSLRRKDIKLLPYTQLPVGKEGPIACVQQKRGFIRDFVMITKKEEKGRRESSVAKPCRKLAIF